jgi:hypothetical protein
LRPAGLFQEDKGVRGPGLEFGGRLVPPALYHLKGGLGQDRGQLPASFGFRAGDEKVWVRQGHRPQSFGVDGKFR